MTGLFVLGHARVAKLKEHLAPQDTPCVHVRHGDDVLCRVRRPICAYVSGSASDAIRQHRSTARYILTQARERASGSAHARTFVFRPTEEVHPVLTLHGRGHGVTEELGLGTEFTNDADLVLGRYVIEGRYGGMVGNCWEEQGVRMLHPARDGQHDVAAMLFIRKRSFIVRLGLSGCTDLVLRCRSRAIHLGSRIDSGRTLRVRDCICMPRARNGLGVSRTCVWGVLAYGFFTPFGLICQPAR